MKSGVILTKNGSLFISPILIVFKTYLIKYEGKIVIGFSVFSVSSMVYFDF